MARADHARGIWVLGGALVTACATPLPSFPAGGTGASDSDHGSSTTVADLDTSSTSATTAEDTSAGTTAALDGDDSTGSTSTSGAGSTGSTGGGSTDTTGEPPSAYPPCHSGSDDECPRGYNCLPVTRGGTIIGSVCGPTCGDATPCPSPSSGNAVPTCVATFNPAACALTCARGSCPDGMQCVATMSGSLCFWPA